VNITIKYASKEFNIGIQTILEFFKSQNIIITPNPNTKLSIFEYELLSKRFKSEKELKVKVLNLKINKPKLKNVNINNCLTEAEKKMRFDNVKVKIQQFKRKKENKKVKVKKIKGYEETIKEFEKNRNLYKIENNGKSIYPLLTPMKG